jgi:hypothetical protein
MNKVDLLAHISRLLQDHALAHDGRINDEGPEPQDLVGTELAEVMGFESGPRILSVSFDCDHKSGELFVLTHGEDGPVEYCISTEHIKETA